MAIFLTFCLVSISFIDIDHQLIPDSIALPLLWVGLGMSLFHPVAGSEVLFIAPKDAIVGAMAGYLSLWSVYQLFKIVTGKEGMGYGDFKLLAALGAWLGWQALPMIIMMSAVVGAIIGISMIVFRRHERSVPIPFGPYLAAAGWITLLYGEAIKNTYLDLML
jgi:leader peptidase (prepilin peptidase)/N-methyltransferase